MKEHGAETALEELRQLSLNSRKAECRRTSAYHPESPAPGHWAVEMDAEDIPHPAQLPGYPQCPAWESY